MGITSLSSIDSKKLIVSNENVDIYKMGDKIIKVFNIDRPKTGALYEALTHARVEATGLPVPIIYEITVVDDHWAIIMENIEGKTFEQIIGEDSENIRKYIEMMLDLQLVVHKEQAPKLSKLKDKLERQINGIDCLSDHIKYELLMRLNSMPKHNKLCHLNFTPANVIQKTDGSLYIIDWIAARQGNASADVAQTYLLLYMKYPEVAEYYIDLFCEKTKTNKKYVQGWLPIIAAARLAENIDEEKEILLKWVNVADYQ